MEGVGGGGGAMEKNCFGWIDRPTHSYITSDSLGVVD